jgi:flagellar protein FliS
MQTGLKAYRQTEVQSRTPVELVVMLYDGALRFAALGSEAQRRGDIRARRDATTRLLAVLSELQSTLDLERGGDVAASLDALYTYMSHRVLAATMNNDAAPLEEIQRLLTPLREAWLAMANGETIDPLVAVGAGAAAGNVAVEQAR